MSGHQAMSTDNFVFASKGARGMGSRVQDQRGHGLFLASVHLGLHKQRLPLLRGHRSPLLLLLEVFLLGQQYFLGIHTGLYGRINSRLDGSLSGGDLPLAPSFLSSTFWPLFVQPFRSPED